MGAVVMAWRVCLIFSLRVSVFSSTFSPLILTSWDFFLSFFCDSIQSMLVLLPFPFLLCLTYISVFLYIYIYLKTGLSSLFFIFQFYKKNNKFKVDKIIGFVDHWMMREVVF